MVDGSNASLYHANEEMHPLVWTFSPSQTIFKNLDVSRNKQTLDSHKNEIVGENKRFALFHFTSITFCNSGKFVLIFAVFTIN